MDDEKLTLAQNEPGEAFAAQEAQWESKAVTMPDPNGDFSAAQDAVTQEPAVISLTLDVQLTPVVNYAQQQNGLPLIRRLAVTNTGEADVRNVELRVSSPDGFVQQKSFFVAQVPPHRTVEVTDAEVSLSPQLLASLTERTIAPVTVEAVCDGDVCANLASDVTFLAFDEWHGDSYYPELLAAFVTPNHPEITKILARAAKLLEQWTGSPSFDAYQTQNPNRVLNQAAAIYTALQELNIVYAVPPASFETAGQRVRLCDAILSAKMGSCLDLSLLYASCLEAAGLFPLILLSRGHAFAGVWLEEMTFQEAVKDDPSLVSKRMADGIAEIAVLECTSVCAGRAASFDEARTAGAAQLNGAEPVRMVLDVHRARLAGIRPLPLRVQSDQGWVVEEPVRAESELSAAPDELAERIGEALSGGTELDARSKKIRQWERKLLDLGLRNALINLRSSKYMIPVLAPSLPQLEDALSDGRQFTIEPRPQEWHLSEQAARSLEPSPELLGAKDLLVSEAQNGRLRTLLGEAELARSVKELYRSARTALEENGANSLYLSLGLLKWYETDRSERARYSPLVLLPIELVRKAANKGYCLRLRDEDPVMNVTLLEMLRQNFGITVPGVEPLPVDAHGVDVVRVFTAVRRAVMQQKRWDVVESAFVGIFSFSRFVMWNDIRNRMSDLEKNKVVQSLMDGHLSWEAAPLAPSREIDEDGLLLPLPVDASQLYAIKAAVAGETFVLHGPPGTGKSQTITGMIINLLAQGKTVLFVAEKMAALSVVQKRLRKLGLDPFCLEIHSNKARKKDVLDQLKAATEITHGTPSQVYAQKAERAAALRAELSGYPRALHAPRTSGLSVYGMISAYEPLSGIDDAGIRLDYERVAAWTAAGLEQNESLLKSLCASASAVGHPAGHPLRLVAETEYSQKLKSALPPLLAPYERSIESLEKAAFALATALERSQPRLKREYKKLRDIASELLIWKSLPAEWARADSPQAMLSGLAEMAKRYIAAGEIAGKLNAKYREAFLSQNPDELRTEWAQLQQKWFLPRYFGTSGYLKKINAYARTPRTQEQIQSDLDELSAYRRELSAAQSLWQLHGTLLGTLNQGNATDWRAVESLAAAASQSLARLEQLDAVRVRRSVAEDANAAPAAEKLLSAWNEHAAARRALNATLKTSEVPSGEPWLEAQRQMCDALRTRSDILRDWIQWNSLCAQACERGLEPVVSAYKNGLAHEAVLPAYRKVLLRTLIEDAIDADDVLNKFSGAVFDEKVSQLKRLIDELSQLCKQEAYNTLAAKVPNFAREASQNSELGILQRAIRSGGRNLSIRRLFEQLPNLLPRLCPCMLMSPISAAQYLDPKREMFDCVIFDEASQLTTSKAVGALARGSSAVVVGDPKQMPPTSFFMTSTDDSEEDPQVADLTSILDDCLALGLPETHLLWHYRSRHESLIAFSNNQFYENKLYTFPSVNDRISRVSFVHVQGQFDRGRTRSNRAEAEVVVAEVIRRAKDPELSKESIGIVTFNIGQQNLIDDLFEEARGRDLALEKWYQQSAEPLFIKNLENVQGDERDVILFSIGFGADKEGRVSMNFGPINQNGGWRRLNVAVSRSRTEMMVFSSLLPEQIDLGRTASEGVAALKAFLQYARTGYLPVRSAAGAAQSAESARGVASEICARLKEAGFETQQQVGHSKFHIDIGVIDPDVPEEYLLGILLDGETYRDAQTVRDREFAQIGVLRGLGWQIERVWTMDWWDNKKRELDRLTERIRAVQAERRAMREQERLAREAAERAAAEAADALSAGGESEHDTLPAPSETPELPPVDMAAVAQPGNETAPEQKQRVAALPPAGETPAESTAAPQDSDEQPEPAEQNARAYHAARLTEKKLTSAAFLLPRNEKMLTERLQQIIDEEAPISARLLVRRLLQSTGIARSTGKIQQHIDVLLTRVECSASEHDGTVFYWSKGQDPETLDSYRASGIGADKREAPDVPPQEAAAAVCDALRAQVALPSADLLREAAKLLGYPRMGPNVTAAVTAGLERAKQQNHIALDRNERYTLTGE